MANDKVVNLNTSNFGNEVINSDMPVLVDFWAAWCMPCRMLGPLVDELAIKYDGKAKVGKVNVDDERTLAATYGIVSIPAVYVFKGGKVIEKLVGVREKSEYENILDSQIK
jgi:thioredoxin 1